MTRYEFITKGGIEEMATALAFILANIAAKNCEELLRAVEAIKPDMLEWLQEEVSDD